MLKQSGRFLLQVVLVTAVMVTAAFAQSLPPTAQAAIDKVFADYNKPDSPGCSLAVYQNGAMAFARGYGRASLEHGVPITPQTVFDIGSTSKQFTAVSIMLLEQDGRLTLDDAVQKHIPELPAYEQPITIRHLLHHTSGLRDYLTLWALAGMNTENWTTQDDAGRRRAPGGPAAARQLSRRSRVPVLEHRLPAAGGDCETGERQEPARVRGRTGVRSAGHDEHVHSRRSPQGRLAPCDRVFATRRRRFRD
jgi:CubicO group peptidase (beta-lactamase class C family)